MKQIEIWILRDFNTDFLKRDDPDTVSRYARLFFIFS